MDANNEIESATSVDFDHDGTTYAAAVSDFLWSYSELREYRDGTFQWIPREATGLAEEIKDAAENAILGDIAAAEGF